MTKLLKEPITTKHIEEGRGKTLNFGVFSMQGWRPTMEDAALCAPDISKGISVFAVFDGHGSNEVADFTKEYFVSVLKGT